jgi:hypothetical protein
MRTQDEGPQHPAGGQRHDGGVDDDAKILAAVMEDQNGRGRQEQNVASDVETCAATVGRPLEKSLRALDA